MHFLSQTQIRVNVQACEKMDKLWKPKTDGEIKPNFAADYVALNEFIQNLDLLTDIMNGKSVSSNGKKEGNHAIRNINDPVIEKLKGILMWFYNWRLQCLDTKEHFITEETWEDLVSMILGTIHMIEKYSVLWEDFELNPSSLQSDICEHHFSNFKHEFPDQTSWDGEAAAGISSDMRKSNANFGIGSKGNCSYEELTASKYGRF
jgi:hypothetical protein